MVEYKFIRYDIERDHVSQLMSELGGEGWKLHSFQRTGYVLDCVFERPLDAE